MAAVWENYRKSNWGQSRNIPTESKELDVNSESLRLELQTSLEHKI